MSITSEQAGAAGRGGTVTPMSAAIPALLLAAVLLVVAPLLGVVTAHDSSSTSPPVHSAWVAALPVVVVALLALARRGIAVAAVAGVGVFGLVRLIADLGVVIDPGETLRPELFGIQTLSANPLQTGWAAWMLILADVLMLAGAALAGSVIADSLEPVAGWNAGRLELDADALGSPESFVGRPRLMKSSPSSVVGIVAAAGYLAANLGELYADPLPVIRPGFNDIGLWGTITAAVAGLLVAMVVLFSSALDAGVARGLLLGLGIGAAGPSLVVLIGSIGNSAATPSPLAWLALVAAALLMVAGLLRREVSHIDSENLPPDAASDFGDDIVLDSGSLKRSNVILGLTALLSAVLSMVAFVLPQASFVFRSYLSQGSAPTAQPLDQDLTAGFAAAGSIFVFAAVVLFAASVLTLIPRTCAWGRTALTLSWAPTVAAFLFALEYVNHARSPELVAGVVFQADTTYRAGLWVGVAATVMAIAAGVMASLVTGRVRDASTEDIPEIELADRAPWAQIIAGALSVLVLIGIGSQAWTSNQGSSAGLYAGADRTDFWGIWLTAIVVIVAFWIAVRQPRQDIALVLFLTSAVILLPRLVLTGAVRDQAGFTLLTGFWLNIVLVVAVLIGGFVAWKLIGPQTWAPASAAAPVAAGPSTGNHVTASKINGSKAFAKSNAAGDTVARTVTVRQNRGKKK